MPNYPYFTLVVFGGQEIKTNSRREYFMMSGPGNNHLRKSTRPCWTCADEQINSRYYRSVVWVHPVHYWWCTRPLTCSVYTHSAAVAATGDSGCDIISRPYVLPYLHLLSWRASLHIDSSVCVYACLRVIAMISGGREDIRWLDEWVNRSATSLAHHGWQRLGRVLQICIRFVVSLRKERRCPCKAASW